MKQLRPDDWVVPAKLACQTHGWRQTMQSAARLGIGTPEWFVETCRDYMPRRPAPVRYRWFRAVHPIPEWHGPWTDCSDGRQAQQYRRGPVR